MLVVLTALTASSRGDDPAEANSAATKQAATKQTAGAEQTAGAASKVKKTEAALDGGASVDDACEILASEIVPIDDVRSTADYRRRVATNLLRRFMADTD